MSQTSLHISVWPTFILTHQNAYEFDDDDGFENK